MRYKQKGRTLAAAVLAGLLLTTQASAASERLVPVGSAVGIRLDTGSLSVAGLVGVDASQGCVYPASEAGILPGDVVLRLGAAAADTTERFRAAAAKLDGSDVTLTVRRGEKTLQYTVTPALGSDGTWQLGLWLRDGIEGIGTVTYYDPETGCYGALGHGICREETGALLELEQGSIFPAGIFQVVRGEPGTPGMLCGHFDRSVTLGRIEANTECGIFGTASAELAAGREALPVAGEEQVHCGAASILSCVDGQSREYAVEITRVCRGAGARSFQFRVTDPVLLERTGGVVQGMSGSPLLQDGCLIGAVTHVLVHDPTQGFAIAIKTMLAAGDTVLSAAA